jgi:CubicO group peptidase (beta-lactamase class C family)
VAALRRATLALAGVLLALSALAAWKGAEIARLGAVLTLFDEGRIVENFSGMDRLFHSVPIPRGDGPVVPLPAGAPIDLPPGVADWVAERQVTALVVLHDGRIVHESYRLGTGASDLRISWSVAKSFLSALLGVLVEEGAIASLDDPVTAYAPDLADSAYADARIRDVLNMASGVAFDEDVTRFRSDLNRMGRVLALGRSMDDFTTGIDATAGPPGKVWRYVSIDTHALGMVIRGATGRTIPELMSEKIVAPLGLETEPYYLTDGDGVAFVLGGLALTTRDYARFGQMFLEGGRVGERQVVPEAWVDASTRRSGPNPQGPLGYGYQWWVPPDAAPGEFMAEGIYGQYVYVNRPAGVVVAVNSADRDFKGRTVANVGVLREIAAAASAPVRDERRRRPPDRIARPPRPRRAAVRGGRRRRA